MTRRMMLAMVSVLTLLSVGILFPPRATATSIRLACQFLDADTLYIEGKPLDVSRYACVDELAAVADSSGRSLFPPASSETAGLCDLGVSLARGWDWGLDCTWVSLYNQGQQIARSLASYYCVVSDNVWAYETRNRVPYSVLTCSSRRALVNL